MISTTQTTWWHGINPDANFCPKCGCSVNSDRFERDWDKFDTFNCDCGWTGTYDKFLKNKVEATKMIRKKKLMKIKNEN